MRSAIILLLTLVLAGCCHSLNFDDLSTTVVYRVGDTITTSEEHIAVEKFQRDKGDWTSTGTVVVDTRKYANGSGLDISPKNANLHFKLDYPTDEISFKFAQLRGNINIRVNGDFRNVQDIVDLNGIRVGGVKITTDAYQIGYYWYGELTLDGTINDFSVGGERLWIDDFCS